MSSDMSWETFLTQINELFHQSKNLNDCWKLEKIHDDPEGTYIKYETFRTLMDFDQKIQENYNPELNEDDPSEDLKPQPILYTFHYHIIYSLSYAVPMLLFNIYDTHGQLIPMEDIQKNFMSKINLEEGKIDALDIRTALTQMEHPLLFKPFYALHPCRTAEILNKTPDSKNFVLTFISLFGPYVGLSLQLGYGFCE